MGRCCNEPHYIICAYSTRVQLSIFSQMLLSELCTPSIKFLSPSNCLILLLFTRFVSSTCDVAHNDDGSCKIFPPLFCFLLDNPTYGKSHYIQQISSKRYRCPDIAFIGRGNDFPLSPTRQGLCITYVKVLLISPALPHTTGTVYHIC